MAAGDRRRAGGRVHGTGGGDQRRAARRGTGSSDVASCCSSPNIASASRGNVPSRSSARSRSQQRLRPVTQRPVARLVGEQAQLLRRRPGRGCQGRAPAARQLVTLQPAQDLARPLDHRRRQAGQPRHLDAVAAVGARPARSCAGRRCRPSTPCTATRRLRTPRQRRRPARSARGSAWRRASWRAPRRRAGARPPPRRCDRPSKVEVPRPISSSTTRLRVVARVQDVGGLVISTMKVDWPRARSSEAPTRVKMRSTSRDCARSRRHEGARLRQQHDQRHLPQVGGLAGHVRAGEHDELRSARRRGRRRWGRSAPPRAARPPGGGRRVAISSSPVVRRRAGRSVARAAVSARAASDVQRRPAPRAVSSDRARPRRRPARADSVEQRPARSVDGALLGARAPAPRSSLSSGVTKRSASTSVCLRS